MASKVQGKTTATRDEGLTAEDRAARKRKAIEAMKAQTTAATVKKPPAAIPPAPIVQLKTDFHHPAR